MKEQRRYYFDIAKGIGIFLVVLGHLEYISESLRYFIVSFHMPLFFVISGMLMNMTQEEKKTPGSFIKGKLKRIALPYLSFSIAFLIIEILYENLITHSFNIWTWVQDLWMSICLYGMSVLWFLPALFFSMILLFFLRRKTGHIVTVVIVVVLTVVSYFLNNQLNYFRAVYYFNFGASELYYPLAMILRCFFSLFYLAAGYYGYFVFEKYDENFFKKESRIRSVISIALGMIILGIIAYVSQINGAVDIHFMIFGNPGLYLLNSMAGSLAIILISRGLEMWSQNFVMKIIRYFGVNSLTVMATHINFYVMYCSILLALHFIKYVTHAKQYVFCTMIVITVFIGEFVLVEIINRYLTFFTGRTKR